MKLRILFIAIVVMLATFLIIGSSIQAAGRVLPGPRVFPTLVDEANAEYVKWVGPGADDYQLVRQSLHPNGVIEERYYYLAPISFEEAVYQLKQDCFCEP